MTSRTGKSAAIKTIERFTQRYRDLVLTRPYVDSQRVAIEVDNVPYRIIEFLHVKPGKGSAFVRTKLKNFLNGGMA